MPGTQEGTALVNLYRLAVIMLRVYGISWVLGGLLRTLSIPGEVLRLLHDRTDYFGTLAITSFVMLLGRTLFDCGIGFVIMATSKSLAKRLTQSFIGAVATAIPLDAWPPAPVRLEATLPSLLSSEDRAAGIHRAAMLVFKVEGIFWLLSLLTEASQLPAAIVGLLHHHGDYWATRYLLSVCVITLHLLIIFGVGLYFLFLPESLAKRITNDLVRDAEAENDFSAPTPPSESVAETDVNTVS